MVRCISLLLWPRLGLFMVAEIRRVSLLLWTILDADMPECRRRTPPPGAVAADPHRTAAGPQRVSSPAMYFGA